MRRLLFHWARSVRFRANRSEADYASHPSWLRYGIAALAVGVALLAKLLLDPLITDQSPFLLLAGAVMVGAWFGGLGPGLLATALGAVAADFFFLPPVGSFTGLGVAFLPLLLFMLQGLLISSLAEALHFARRRADTSALEARSHLERLRQSEERFRLLVQGVADYAIFKLDPQGRVASWNEGAERIKGYRAEEIVGEHFSRFYTEEDIERGHPKEVLRIATEDGRYEEEGIRVRKDGSRFWASIVITALRDKEGELRGFSKVVRDITERKEAEKKLRESEELYRSVVEQAAENIFLVDVETKCIIRANAALHRSLGYSTEELRRLTLYDIVAHAHGNIEGNVHYILEEGRDFIGERQYRRKDGSLIDVEVSASAISYSGRDIMCVVAHDVTERKKAEKELHELVGRIMTAQEEERRRVAYDIHDGFTQMAAAAYRRLQTFIDHHPPEAAQDRQELEDAVALVQRTVGEARHIIANLRPTTLDDFGLATAIRMQVEELRFEGFDASYEGTLGEERLPATLETALFRVIQEALGNVRKHAQTDRMRVALGRHDGFVRLEVRDWGRGFEPAKVGEGGGPGERVGLSSMRERIALLGGSLEIHSEPGAGTSVVAEVPLPTTGERKVDSGE